MKKLIERCLIIILSFLSFNGFGQGGECVEVYFVENQISENEMILDVRANNFTNISAFHITVLYSPDHFTHGDIVFQNSALEDFTSYNLEIEGEIRSIWTDPFPEDLEDGSILFSIRMTINSDLPSIIEFGKEGQGTEFFNLDDDDTCIIDFSLFVNDEKNILRGKIIADMDISCSDSNDDLYLENLLVQFASDTDTFYRNTNQNGEYFINLDSGSYAITPIVNSGIWDDCEQDLTVEFDNIGDTVYQDIFLVPLDCPSLSVTISTPILRRCFDNKYTIKYENNGSAPEEDVYIVIHFDDNLDYISSSTSNITWNGQVATMNIGELGINESGTFDITMNVNCDNTTLGQTLCASAEIFPQTLCGSNNQYTGAILETEATCDEDSVIFIIYNNSDFDMAAPLQSIVVEDDVMINMQDVQLASQSNEIISLPANGSVYRIIVDQETEFPLGTFSTDFLVTCNGEEENSFHFVSLFPNDDESPFIDIECNEIVGSYDPNDKAVFPVGYGENNLIHANTDLEYTIRFQNTGTDSAINVVIKDSIDISLDLSSLKLGPSSHPYEFSIDDERTMIFRFSNIYLPDSSTDLDGSQGYVRYKIAQKKDRNIGTEINNSADIFFDFNEPITTNTVSNVIGEDYLEVILNNDLVLLDDELLVSPNPANIEVYVELPQNLIDVSYVLTSMDGRVASAAHCPQNAFTIQKGYLDTGMYVLTIYSGNKLLGRKKIIFAE